MIFNEGGELEFKSRLFPPSSPFKSCSSEADQLINSGMQSKWQPDLTEHSENVFSGVECII